MPLRASVVLGFALAVAYAPETALGRTHPSHERYVAHLESAERSAWQKPDEVVRALGLRGGETVVDLGAGTGYFATRLARAVGEAGVVKALDVDGELLAYLKRRLEKERISNVDAALVPKDDPKLPPASVDLVFLANVYHHLPDRPAYLAKMVPALREGGRIAIVDYEKREGIPDAPPLDERVDRSVTIEELRRAGLRLEREVELLPRQYFLVFALAERYSMETLIADLDRLRFRANPSAETLASVASLVERFVREGRLDPRFERPSPGLPVTTYLVHTAPGGSYSIAALVLRPRARTPIHDHQTWTVWGTYQGRERETRYRIASEDGAELEKVFERVLPDEGISTIPPPPGDIHELENIGAAASVSIHVHGADMSKQTRNRYEPARKAVLPFVQSYQTVD